MEIKERPNHRIYLDALKKMTPEDKLKKVFELSQLGRDLFILGIQNRYPALSETEVKKIYLERLKQCYNRNY
ncbi:MAG: hypothetical protein AB1420_12665 [Bacillota bacterium]